MFNVKHILLLSEKMKNKRMIGQNIDGQNEDLELPFYSLATIAIATNKFSSNNKLGEGGFGLVYKVTMQHAFIKITKKQFLPYSTSINK